MEKEIEELQEVPQFSFDLGTQNVEDENTEPIEDQKLILGEKIANPYSVENMQIAYETLMTKQPKIPLISNERLTINEQGEPIETVETIADDFVIETNHYYLKFWCETPDDLQIFNDLGIEYAMHPLDQEITQEGQLNLESEEQIEEEIIDGFWIYTSIAADYDLTSIGLEYEILEELFLLEPAQGGEADIEEESELALEDSSIKIPRIQATGNEAKQNFLTLLEAESFYLTGNEFDSEEVDIHEDGVLTPCWLFCGSRDTKPDGYIRVWNTIRNDWEGVEGIKIRTYRWFVWGQDHTDQNGYWKVNVKYRGNVWSWLDFDNPANNFKIYSSWLSVSDKTYYIGYKSKTGFDWNISRSSTAWKYATVNNAIVKYKDIAPKYGVNRYDKHIRVNVTNPSSVSGAKGNAAMLGTIPSGEIVNEVSRYLGGDASSILLNYFYAANVKVALSAYVLGYLIRKTMLPDVWVGVGDNASTVNVEKVTHHEMAHVSHFDKVGEGYWVKFISHIIFASDVYGDGTEQYAGYTGVGEMWANYYAAVVMDNRYHKGDLDNINFYLNEYEEWFNPGFLDLVENRTDVSVSKIFNVLNNSTNSIDKLVSKLKEQTNEDEEAIDEAFSEFTDWP